MPRRASLLGVLAIVSVACTLFAQVRPPDANVLGYDQLPEPIRAQILLGSARPTARIDDSPFGTHTTLCAEGGDGELATRAARAISEAGYKWVVEYLPARWSVGKPPEESAAALWAAVPPRCTSYAKQLHELGFKLLMRLDPLPASKLTGGSPLEPTDLKLAAAFARQTVRELKPYVQHWQIGNEPNTGNAPEAYVQVAAAVSAAIRGEQPDAVVYGPATAMLQCLVAQPFPWVARALSAGLLQHIDVFSYHPYRASGDGPEQASEFARWRKWSSYYTQIEELRRVLRAAPRGKDMPIATTEDGESSAISASGEQHVTWVIDAKNELRRGLQDFWLGVYPRTHFAFFRHIPDAFYSTEGSFNAVTSAFEKKPLYFAAQNLHAVLDSSYKRDDKARVALQPRERSDKLGKLGSYIQTYTKQHGSFDELLVFFWSTAPAGNMHLRVPAELEVTGTRWQAPVLIDLMTMPGKAPPIGHTPSTHTRWQFPTAHKTRNGIAIEGIEIRDYPQLLKLIDAKD